MPQLFERVAAFVFALLMAMGTILATPARAQDTAQGAPRDGAPDAAQTPPRAGPEAIKLILAELGRVENEPLQQYVDAVGQRVARAAVRHGTTFRFFVVDQWMPNAFALSDGSIFVSRGVLALASSEDELANVLAHEVVHVAERHAIGLQAVAEDANPFVIGIARATYLAGFNRDQERDADRAGQALAAASGYDPRAMAEFLRKLEYSERLELGASRIPSFFDTHPSTVERAGTTYDRGASLSFTKQPGIAADAAEFVKRLEGLTIDDDPSQGIFRGTRFLHPDLDFTLYFPDGWTPVNTPKAVGAFTPRRDARIALELAGDGDDPQAVAHAYLSKRLPEVNATLERAASITLGGRPAYEALASVPTPAGVLLAQLTFVPLGRRIYLLSTVASAPAFGGYRGRAAATVRSLRPLEAKEREGIRVMRLWSIRAEEGESLEEISRRARNELDLQRTAVVNGLFTEARLRKGQLLKVARTEPYRSPEKPAAAPAVAAPDR